MNGKDNGKEMAGGDPGNGRRPVPDPTALTTQALYREVANLQEVIERSIEGTRLINEEKFRRVEQQFELVERGRIEQKEDTKAAVDAALTAQKEAVREQTTASERAIAKSEAATTKQLEQLANTFNTEASALRRELGEVKDRIGDVDRKTSAVVDQKIGAKDDRTGLYAAIAVIATILLAVLALIGTFVAN